MENNVSQAIRDEDIDSMKYILSQGFEINVKYDFSIGCEKKSYGHSIQWTPLHYAAGFGSEKMVKLLIDNGADATITDATGRTAQQIGDLLSRYYDIDEYYESKQKN
eukprot:gene6544-10550_t